MPVQSFESSKEILRTAYAHFNARNIRGVLDLMKPYVVWPNAMEGGYVYGHAGVREYWTRQWKMIDPHVEPIDFATDENGNISVNVHQVVRDLSGNLLLDQKVKHIYSFEDGLIKRMEIESA
jgi:hypothetical protein